MTKLTYLTAALVAASLSFTPATPVLAEGADTPPKTTNTTKTCKKGRVWDAQSGKCLKVQSHNFSDDALYEAAREFAYAGQYDHALDALDAAQNQNDPRILNYRGFTHRKLGHHAKAMEYYQAALQIDPDYILARSYMGQGLLAYGDEEGARAQLAEIRARGGRNSWSYTALAMALRGAAPSY